MFILAAIAIVSIGIVYTQNYDVKTELSQQDSDSLIPPGDKIKQKIHTKEIANLSEIKDLKGYDISIGKNLPKGYKVQYVAGSIPPDNYVNIYVGKEPITDETTDMGFVYGGGGGVSVTITPYDPTVHTKEALYGQMANYGQEPVEIPELQGYGHDIIVQEVIEDLPTTAPAELNFVKGDKYVFLIGKVSLDTLIEIAKNF